MDKKEKEMEEQLGGLLVDYDKENLKLKKANTLGSNSISSGIVSKDKQSSKQSTKPMNMFNRFGAKPLHQKKVVATQQTE